MGLHGGGRTFCLGYSFDEEGTKRDSQVETQRELKDLEPAGSPSKYCLPKVQKVSTLVRGLRKKKKNQKLVYTDHKKRKMDQDKTRGRVSCDRRKFYGKRKAIQSCYRKKKLSSDRKGWAGSLWGLKVGKGVQW